MKFSFAVALLVCAPSLYSAEFANGQAARAVIGQITYGNRGVTASQQVVGAVSGLSLDPATGSLWAAEGNLVGETPVNNRVLRFETSQIQSPTADLSLATNPAGDTYCGLCGYNADLVLGQVDYASTMAGRSQFAPSTTSGSMSSPTAVATDGVKLAVADSSNNRILIWNSIPSSINASPDVVIGQADFNALQPANTISASTLRAPQGVWLQNGKMFVADTGNNRVLIWNSIPASNTQAADLVLGQSSFSTNTAPSLLSTTTPTAAANVLWNPISVTVSPDGSHLLVADFGYDRVLIWNSIPTQNQQGADVVVGQADMTGSLANNSSAVCASNGKDSSGNPTYPDRCEATLNHPRFALSDGTRLFIADSGNDRVLVYNQLPTANKAAANVVLGQPDFTSEVIATNTSTLTSVIDNTGSVDTIQLPLSLASDGVNLYVSDPVDNRILIFTPGDVPVGSKHIVNNASKIIKQEGVVTLSGKVVANDTVTITIQGTAYTYTEKSGDTLDSVENGLISAVNAKPDPNAQAFRASAANSVVLLSRGTNNDLNTISYSTTSSNTSDITATAAGSYLAGGNSGTVAPGTLIEIDNPNLAGNGSVLTGFAFADFTLTANTSVPFPITMRDPAGSAAAVQVFIDGLPVPIMYASPAQLVVQVPYSFINTSNSNLVDRNSLSVYVRTVHSGGSISVTTASPVVFTDASPGLFGVNAASEPRPALGAFHQTGNPTAIVSIDGTAQAGDTITITINSRNYTYTVQTSDTLANIVTGLVTAISNANDPDVTAAAGGAYTRVVLTARKAGAAGSGIPVSGSVSAQSGKTATETVTAYNSTTCCSTSGSGLVTAANPAQPNEIITFLATGLGVVTDTGGALVTATAGVPFDGAQPNSASSAVVGTVNGSTGQIISAGLPKGAMGVYQVQIQMPATLPASGVAGVYIAQGTFISNTVTIPVGSTGSSPISVFIDTPSPNVRLTGGSLVVAGWAIDNSSSIVDVSLYVDGALYVQGAPRQSRPDVCAAHPSAQDCVNGQPVGWAANINTSSLPRGSHVIAVVATAADGNQNSATTTFSALNAVQLFLDTPAPGATVKGTISVGGWAISTNATLPVSGVTFTLDGIVPAALSAEARPDVCAVYPRAVDCANGNPNVGFGGSLDTTLLANGAQTIVVQATDGSGLHGTISRTITVNNAASDISLYIDSPGNPTSILVGQVNLSGWSYSLSTLVDRVTVSIDGSYLSDANRAARPDVCVAHPSAFGCPSGSGFGWSLPFDSLSMANGSHEIEVTAFAGGRSQTVAASFTVSNWTNATPVHANIDVPALGATVGGVISPAGWAISDHAAISSVTLAVDNVPLITASYGGSRPDVCAAYPGRAGCPDVGWSIQVDTTLLRNGEHTLSATALAADGEVYTTSKSFIVSNPSSPLLTYIDTNLSQPLNTATVISGWTGSTGGAVTSLTALVDGSPVQTLAQTLNRPDVCNIHPTLVGCPAGVLGWQFTLDPTLYSPGTHILGISADAAGGNRAVYHSFTVGAGAAPSGLRAYIDTPKGHTTLVGIAQLSGWAVDGSGNLNTVSLAVDGVPLSVQVTYTARPDVCAAFQIPGSCSNSGWSAFLDTRNLADGVHTVDLTGNFDGGHTTVSGTFTVANWTNTAPVQLVIEVPSATSAALAGEAAQISGYAYSELGPVSSLTVSVDGVVMMQPATYGIARHDICDAILGTPGCPNVGWSYGLDTTVLADGVHTLVVTASVGQAAQFPMMPPPQQYTVSTTFTVQNFGQ